MDFIDRSNLRDAVIRRMANQNASHYEFGHIERVAFYAKFEPEHVGAWPVALCHDFVEDGYGTYDDLATMGLTATQIDAVRLLTRTEGVTYRDYISNLVAAYNTSAGKLAARVKQFDIYDHLHPDRIADRSHSGLTRYLDALEEILRVQVVR